MKKIIVKKKIISGLLALCLGMSLCLSVFASDSLEEIRNTDLQALPLEIQNKENIACEKYNLLLKEWAYDPNYIDDVNADFPEFYGGAYINEDKELVIQVTELDKEIRGYFSDIIDLSDVIFQIVEYSYDELKYQKEELVAVMDPASEDDFISSISGVGISIPENSVSLYVYSPENTNARTATMNAENEVKALSSFENIDIIITNSKDEVATTISPGEAISNGNYSRSVGFWAENSKGELGIVTAPHASISEGTIIKVGTTTFGVAETPCYSGDVDAVFIKCTNESYSPTRYVPGWGFFLESSAYVALPVGATTYSRGITSSIKMGTIQDTNYTTSYGISNTVVTSALCQAGDSGGIVAGNGTTSLRYVAGIITGAQGGTNYQIYVKGSNIMSRLGVWVY